MKYLIILIDGAADISVPELNGKTPLQVAYKPHIDQMACQGEMGLVKTIPQGFPPGSDVANLAVMGYDPSCYYTGRSPLEAISIGVQLEPTDIAIRCNLVTLSKDHPYRRQTMIDYSADEISTVEAEQLIEALRSQLSTETFHFYSGISYRHLLIWRSGPAETRLIPPHDITDRVIEEYLPAGPGGEPLLALMERSQDILSTHPVNQSRIARGLRPANSIWLWGQGKKPHLDSFYEKYGLRGVTVSAVDLIKGLGICAGLQVIEVPGATGNIHTNFSGKAEAAVNAFKNGADFVYLHFEAADEAGHRGEIDNKIKAIEKIDADVVRCLKTRLPEIDPNYRVMILPDHPTPLTLKTHTAEAVPFLIFDSVNSAKKDIETPFDETNAAQTGLYIPEGYHLMDRFIGVSNGT